MEVDASAATTAAAPGTTAAADGSGAAPAAGAEGAAGASSTTPAAGPKKDEPSSYTASNPTRVVPVQTRFLSLPANSR